MRPDSEALKAKALEIHHRLCGVFSCPVPYFHSLDPVSELVSSLLSHRTRNADSGRAFRALRARYPTWEALRDAPTPEVQKTIAGVTWPELKAPRIQAILRAVTERRGALSLDFLGDLPVAEARAWLEGIPGVGPKTSAAVLNFSLLRKPALPVDSHHHRVAQRTGLIPASIGCRAVPRGARGAAAVGLGRAGRVRPPRSLHAARPAVLLLPQPRLRTLRAARPVSDRTASDDRRREPRRAGVGAPSTARRAERGPGAVITLRSENHLRPGFPQRKTAA
jgi:endonuclease III